METEEAVLTLDPIPADEAVIAIDPIEMDPIVIADPVPVDPIDGSSDTPPDAETFGGPDDSVPTDEVTPPADDTGSDVPADGGSGDDAPVDDGGLIKITVIDPFPVDEPGDGATDGSTGGDPVDVVPVDGSGDEVIGRPVDPQPEWRTLDGNGDGSSGDGDGDGTPILVICDMLPGDGVDILPVFDKKIDVDTGADTDSDTGTDTGGGSDTPDDVIYTIDPVIYSTTAVLDEAPGRPADPEPNWRGGPAPALEVESDPAPIHYAASESFHTGLDLL